MPKITKQQALKNKENNYAFIDSQNVYKGTRRDLGWELDWSRYHVYLKHKYQVTKAYLFIGFMPEHNDIYDELQQAGFILKFKPVLPNGKDGVKGNIDADLVLQAMIDYQNYDKAVIVSSNGDFYSLVRYLYDNKKILAVLSPHRKTCSSLLRKSAKDKMVYMDKLKNKLSKRKSTA
ncbi:NYN domain-containing protein [Candidatus Wolfebacteria bacterium]|nr:NYN domain-containing protein [Candidatus Wolfebacteria bacterium]